MSVADPDNDLLTDFTRNTTNGKHKVIITSA